MGKYSSKKDEWFDHFINEAATYGTKTKRQERREKAYWKRERTRDERRRHKKKLREAVQEMENRGD